MIPLEMEISHVGITKSKGFWKVNLRLKRLLDGLRVIIRIAKMVTAHGVIKTVGELCNLAPPPTADAKNRGFDLDCGNLCVRKGGSNVD